MMSEPSRDADALKDELRQLFEGYAEVFSTRGYDLGKIASQWAKLEAAKLLSPGAADDLSELSDNGCVPQIICGLLALLRWSPKAEQMWERVYSRPDIRSKAQRSLEKSAAVIEELFNFTISLEDKFIEAKFAAFGHLPPSRLAAELKAYGRFLAFLNRYPRDAQLRSFADFARFLLTDYVKAATGRFRDRNVSGLVSTIIGSDDYHEVAQRMWRHRNYARIKKRYPRLSELLVTIGQELQTRT
jgi:hypothetical protein